MSLKKLYQEHIDFLRDEFRIQINESSEIDELDDEAFESLYQKLIFIEETDYNTERGVLAGDIVTYMLTLTE